MEPIEVIAQVQHEIWSHWMNYLFSVCTKNPDGTLTIPAEMVNRWYEQTGKKYDELSNTEKLSDIDQAMKVVNALRQSGFCQ
jgi:hypothetical protein